MKHIRRILLPGLVCFYAGIIQVWAQETYVRTWTASTPDQDPNDLVTHPLSDVKQLTQYFDGLGRPIQTVAKLGSLESASGNNYDLVNVTGYDAFGRGNAQYLPYVATGTDGSYKTDAATAQPGYYGNSTNPIAGQGENGSNAHTQINFEPSPLDRPVLTMSPGNSWVGSNRGLQTGYWVNTATDDVRMFSVTDNGLGSWGGYTMTGSYAAGTLYKTITADENSHQVVEFKDMDGRVVLKKVAIGTSDNGSGSGYTGWQCTYYIYDNLNNLRCVLQPAGVQTLTGNGWSFTATVLAEQCFRFEYDQRNRNVMKQVPGDGALYMVYNVKNMLVMTQDANMRGNGKWMVTVYDTLDRPVETGLLNDVGGLSGELNNAYFSTSYPSTASGFEMLTQIHYDDYNGLPTGLTSTLSTAGSWSSYTNNNSGSFPYPVAVAAITATSTPVNTKGLVTWTQSEVLGSNGAQYINAVNIYDDKKRVIQTQVKNFSGGLDVTTTQYTWPGQPLVVVQSQQKGGNNPQTTVAIGKMTYDALGRMTATTKQVQNTLANSNALSSVINVSGTQYDALGQMRSKTLGGGLETQTFDYNIRGWLLGVNRSYVEDLTSTDASNTFDGWSGSGESFTGLSATNFFGYELSYDKAPVTSGAGGSALNYNGNITSMVWKGSNDSRLREYNFSYDAVNRLMKADFNQYIGSSFSKNISGGQIDFSCTMGDGSTSTSAYDANGNILSMTKMGMNVGQSTSIAIDQLAYGYVSGSNRINQITDAANGNTPAPGAAGYLGDYHYASGAGNAAIYAYDANGNLTSDGNKSISGIVYNILNLPQTITVTGKGTITYTYDASGNKLQKNVTQGSLDTITLYDEGIIYVNDGLQFVPTEEGRLRVSSGAWVADYYLKDHLGNVRMVITSDNSVSTHILEWTHYYPFGMAMTGISEPTLAFGKVNHYKYNGIEFDNDLALNEYDAFYRNLDPQTGRWWQLDPKPDYSINLYSAMGDNPISNMDYLGDTLTLGNSATTQTDILSLVGDYTDVVNIKDGKVSIDFDKAKTKFTDKKGNLNQKKYDKYIAGAKKDAGVQLLSDLSTDEKQYLYDAGTSIDAHYKQGENGTWFTQPVNYADRAGKMWVGSPGQNLSITPRGDEAQTGFYFQPAGGYDGSVLIPPGTPLFRISQDGSTMNTQSNRPSMVYHELRENYVRTHDGKSYQDAHEEAIKQEGNAYQNPHPGVMYMFIYNK